mmetsp:Transcript_14528/g.36501  ORF Transcript_14528/g.36501 Transcript_14528/m.36501 type:complete len:241 (-) Transcript_14528:701-1423(-)
MYGRAALQPLKIPRTLTRKTASKFSGSTSSVFRLVAPTIPAACTRTSILPPLSLAILFQILATVLSSPTSHASPLKIQLGANSLRLAQAASREEGSRSTIVTRVAPSFPKRAAIPYPIPLAPPVTMHDAPASRPKAVFGIVRAILPAAFSAPDLASGPTIGEVSVPIPSISHSTTSPGTSHRGGLRKHPTPGGVPVAMTSPARSVVNRETNSIIVSTPKTNWLVLESCKTSPLTRQRMPV